MDFVCEMLKEILVLVGVEVDSKVDVGVAENRAVDVEVLLVTLAPLVLVEVEDVNVNLVRAVLGGIVQVIGVHASNVTLTLLVLIEVGEIDVNIVVQLVVLDVEVEHDVLAFEDVFVDVDVVELNVLGDDIPELVDANVVQDVDVLEEVPGDVGIVELVVHAVQGEHDLSNALAKTTRASALSSSAIVA
eukprot:3474671-Amphidinium_carterae.3